MCGTIMKKWVLDASSTRQARFAPPGIRKAHFRMVYLLLVMENISLNPTVFADAEDGCGFGEQVCRSKGPRWLHASDGRAREKVGGGISVVGGEANVPHSGYLNDITSVTGADHSPMPCVCDAQATVLCCLRSSSPSARNNIPNDCDSPQKTTPKYHCDQCSNDVTNTVRIRCADKDCPDFDLCVTCFCEGKEPMKHKSWHDYRVVKPHAFPIFSPDWDADEELLLVEAAEKQGMGNWQAIADYVGTKTRDECERHYVETYVESKDWPLPNMNLHFDISEGEFRERKRARLHAMQGRSPLPIKGSGSTKAGAPLTSGPTFHEIQGYMPRRLEFETEVENDAEQTVKDMMFGDEDAPEEVELKLMVLDIYNSKLDKRAERRKLIFERGLLEYKKNLAADKKRTKDDRDLHARTRVFARLQTSADYEKFVKGLLDEQRLRDRIAQLQEWRSNGITTIKNGELYEKDKMNRATNIKTFIARESERAQARAASRQAAARIEDTPSRASTPKPIGRKPANPLVIKEAEGVHLLTEEEQQLCSSLRIMPRPYLVIKETILKECARLGGLKRRQARQLIKIDVNKTSRIYDFFVEVGWIRPPRGGQGDEGTAGGAVPGPAGPAGGAVGGGGGGGGSGGGGGQVQGDGMVLG
ncbi:hypothetical protein BC938DRAFT_473218 [Jimgerdemannia flammicorona]|uniref:Transcriptional adapter 2 n=1 Tax=Jimgerdemannia flammicorona TaxID=994334 RepID=A0A433Q4G2_9FUNG|nr:hypothetical protein BC938DRAFT_473218 [Jimgerdemannia flammicorona]